MPNYLTSDGIESTMKLLALCFVNFLYFAPFAYAMDLPQNQDDGSEDYERGEQLFSKYQFVEALDAYKIAAEKGDPRASLYILYMMTCLGFGINWDVNLLKDYRLQADGGVRRVYENKIRHRGLWFQERADSDKASDLANLVLFYLYFRNGEKLKFAIDRLKKVCDQRNSIAYILLSQGLKCQNNASDNEESLKYMEIAADMGNPIAFEELGLYFAKRDNELSFLYLKKGFKFNLPNIFCYFGMAEENNLDVSLFLLQEAGLLGKKHAIDLLKKRYKEDNKLKELHKCEMISCDFGYSNPDELSIEGYVPGMLAACWDEKITHRCGPLLFLNDSLLPELWKYIVQIILEDEINAFNVSQR